MPELAEIFGLTKPLWEIVIRGSAAILALVILFRVLPKRNVGHLSPNDILVVVIIGAMGADAIMGGSHSVGDLLVMMALVFGWTYVLDIVEYRVPLARRLLRDDETRLVEDGRMLRRNMRREMVTEDELMSALRRQGIADLSQVKSAVLEADGDISFLEN